MSTDWREWHSRYDRPDTVLARRLGVVRRRVRESLAARSPEETIRILSLCAGEGRDLLPLLAEIDEHRYRAVLVEKDQALAAKARASAAALGLGRVAIIVGDAGWTSTFRTHLPADLLLLCGIFGNVSEDDIRSTVAATPAMLRPGGTVIWTRGDFAPDLRPLVRAWFVQAGLEEVSFDGAPEPFGVGVARLASTPERRPELPEQLFVFTR